MSSDGDGPAGWIDPLIHAPASLQIVMQLFVVRAVDATFLLNRTGLTMEGRAAFESYRSKMQEALSELPDTGIGGSAS